MRRDEMSRGETTRRLFGMRTSTSVLVFLLTGTLSDQMGGVTVLLMIDNYDSFTFNLVQYLGEMGQEIEVRRNDAVTLGEIAALRPEAIVLSPGPCTPNEAGICLDLIARFAGQTPILGVCLGHQAIGQAFGGEVVRAPRLMHGKTSLIHHDARTIYAGLSNPFVATRYHSLIVKREPSGLPGDHRLDRPGRDHGPQAPGTLRGGGAVPSRIDPDRGREALVVEFYPEGGSVLARRSACPGRAGAPEQGCQLCLACFRSLNRTRKERQKWISTCDITSQSGRLPPER